MQTASQAKRQQGSGAGFLHAQSMCGAGENGGAAFDRPLSALVAGSLQRLISYCEKNDWSGYDPYDALNSRFFARLPAARSKICRLAFTQALKRCPFNLRPLLRIPKQRSAKALALFVMAMLRLRHGPHRFEDKTIQALIRGLLELRSPGQSEYCWGYHFDWQGRHFLTPRFSPNIICTTFAANCLLDAHEAYGSPEYLNAATSAGWFILAGLNIHRCKSGICFSYTPHDRGKVHNANLLAAALLSRLSARTGEAVFAEHAADAVRYSVSCQNPDGSWFYGEHETQNWIDNFHTGYNLVALRAYSRYADTAQYESSIQRGYSFYRKHFFTPGAKPKYFSGRTYPIDIHCVAQSIITLTSVLPADGGARGLLRDMLEWACRSMQSDEGYFYYQQGRFMKNRIPYIRWSQAWMLYALSLAVTAPDQAQRLGPGPLKESMPA